MLTSEQLIVLKETMFQFQHDQWGVPTNCPVELMMRHELKEFRYKLLHCSDGIDLTLPKPKLIKSNHYAQVTLTVGRVFLLHTILRHIPCPAELQPIIAQIERLKVNLPAMNKKISIVAGLTGS